MGKGRPLASRLGTCEVSVMACIVTHGGAANVPDVADGCARACARGLARGSALEAVVEAVVVLEDDPRMNAGTGSVLRIGGSAQMDAAVMDAHGFGAVAVVEGVKNPVRLARAVYDSPHLLLAGPGAMELAERLGIERADVVTDRARARYAERVARLGDEPLWRGVPQQYWRGACDTVGAVCRDDQGAFAAAGSTGGLWCSLRGRVGDVPIPGAGLYVGAAGAVAATGVGEVIWREMISRRVHDAMAAGMSAQQACDDAVAMVRERHAPHDVGVIALDQRGYGVAVTGRMPWAAAE
jgi:beta-aspartyl-peptidase (threonine type)